MEPQDMRNELMEILSGICNSKSFWNMEKGMKGECFFLGYLLECGGSSTPRRMAEFLNVSGARITAILTTLQAKQFVERRMDSDDKRRITVHLTERGREYVCGVQAQLSAYADRICRLLGTDDTAELVRIGKKLIQADRVGVAGETQQGA